MIGLGELIVGTIMEVFAGVFGNWAKKSTLRKKIHLFFWLSIVSAMCLLFAYFGLTGAYEQKSWVSAFIGIVSLLAMFGFWILALWKWQEIQ